MKYTMKALMAEHDVLQHQEQLAMLRLQIGRSFGIAVSKHKYEITLVFSDRRITYNTIEELINALKEMIL